MEQQNQSTPTGVKGVQDAATSNRLASAEMFKEGLALLRGSGVQQDFAMASARLLDAADLHHSGAYFYCALLYFCGVGVSRNTQSASDFANRYLEADSQGAFAKTAKEIIDGTLGTENAKKLLLTKPAAQNPVAASSTGKKKGLLFAAIGVPVVLIAAVAAFTLTKGGKSSAPDSISGIALENLLPKEDVEQARKEALSIAATLQADAQVTMQQQKAALEAQAKIEQEQKIAQEAQAKAEQEQKVAREAQAKAEQDRLRVEAEARRAAPPQANRQVAMMITSARDAANQGQFDRANGILDGVLVGDPSNQEALSLKAAIKQARSRAVNSLQIK